MKKSLPPLLALAFAGALLVTAFAPIHWHYLAPIIMSLLYRHCYQLTPKQAWWRGYAFGVGLFGVGTWWIFIAVHNPIYGIHNPLVAAGIALSLILWLACFPALSTWSMQKMAPHHSLFKASLLFPTLWTVSEWLRGHVLTGFPWMSLGYSQIDTPLQGFAPIFGVYGVGFILTAIGGLLAYSYLSINKQHKAQSALIIIAIATIGGIGTQINWTQPSSKKALQTALLQMNIPIAYKWHLENQMTIYRAYESATKALLHQDKDIIVWPEGAVPAYLHQFESSLGELGQHAASEKSVILVGIPIRTEDKSYNSIIALGHGSGIYRKHHLVPFGEYWPFLSFFQSTARMFHLAVSMYTPGPPNQAPLFFDQTPIAPYICYEITYPNLVRESLKNSALLVTITDDAWFGDSIASAQHLEMAQMRSLENGRDQLFDANTGITAAIDAKGKVIKRLPPNTRDVLSAKVFPMKGHTPWHYLGNWPFWFLSFIVLSIATLNLRKTFKDSVKSSKQ